jgi:hypothetical protein
VPGDRGIRRGDGGGRNSRIVRCRRPAAAHKQQETNMNATRRSRQAVAAGLASARCQRSAGAGAQQNIDKLKQ